MIHCPVSQFARYASLHPLFSVVNKILQELTPGAFAAGRTDISPDLYVSASPQARTRPASQALLEAHRTFIDVQLILEGTDIMGWAPLAFCTSESAPYDSAKDIVFFQERPQNLINVRPGQLVVFFPEDAHAPLMGNGETINKLVVKVRCA